MISAGVAAAAQWPMTFRHASHWGPALAPARRGGGGAASMKQQMADRTRRHESWPVLSTHSAVGTMVDEGALPHACIDGRIAGQTVP